MRFLVLALLLSGCIETLNVTAPKDDAEKEAAATAAPRGTVPAAGEPTPEPTSEPTTAVTANPRRVIDASGTELGVLLDDGALELHLPEEPPRDAVIAQLALRSLDEGFEPDAEPRCFFTDDQCEACILVGDADIAYVATPTLAFVANPNRRASARARGVMWRLDQDGACVAGTEPSKPDGKLGVAVRIELPLRVEP